MATSRKVPDSERHWLRVLGTLNELQARVLVAQKALEEGRGGISRLSRLTGMSRPTIMKGIAELEGKALAGVPKQQRTELLECLLSIRESLSSHLEQENVPADAHL